MATVTEHRIENGWVLEGGAAPEAEIKPQAVESVDKPIENGWVLEEPRAAARPAPDLNFSDMMGASPVPPASTKVPAVTPAPQIPAGIAPPAVVGEAIKPRTDQEAAESILGAPPKHGILSAQEPDPSNAPEPLPRDLAGSVTAPSRQPKDTDWATFWNGLVRQPRATANAIWKNTMSAQIGTALGAAQTGQVHETREEQQYDPARLEAVVAGALSIGVDPTTLATFAVGGAAGSEAARFAASLLVKRLGPAAALRAIQSARSVGGGAVSFGLYDAALEGIKQATQVAADRPTAVDAEGKPTKGMNLSEIAGAGKRGVMLGAAMGAGGAAVMGGPALLRTATEIGVLASAPPILEGRAPTVDDWLDAGIMVGTLKGAHRLSGLAKRALEKPAPQRTPIEAQVVANLPGELRIEIAQDALKTASERALERADNLHLGEVAAGEPPAGSKVGDLRSALEGPKPEAKPLPTAAQAAALRRGLQALEAENAASDAVRYKPAPALKPGEARVGGEYVPGPEERPGGGPPEPPPPGGPLRSARELQGGKPEAPGLPQERQAQDRAQMAEAVQGQADQARARLYQQVPGSFRAFVESQGRRWPIGVTEPGYFALRGQYDDIVKPLYEVRGPRLGNWEIVNRVTGQVEATAPNRVFAQMEANRLDLRRHVPTVGPARPEIAPPAPAPAAEAQPTPAVDTGGPHEFSSTQVDLPERLAGAIKRLAASIPDEKLAEKGREDRPHVTVRFGLHTPEAAPVEKALEGESPARVRLGKLGVFKTPESDVLYAEVESPDLVRLNQKLGALPNTQTHPEYKPHATIAYLKPGQGAPFVGDARLAGQEATLDTVAFSPKEGGQPAAIRLGAAPAVPAPAAPQVPVTPIAGRPGRPAPVPKVPRGTPRQNLPRGQIAATRQEAPPAAEVSQAFDPSDIDQVARFVRSRGGLAPSPTGDLKGEYAAIPLRFKNRRGLTPDLMAQAMSEAAGRPIEDHEILGMLARSGRLRAEKAERATTEGQAPGRADELDEMRDLPDDVKARRIAAMTGLSEAEAFRMIERQRGAPEAVAQERADRDAAEFQMAARDFFEGHPDERPAPEVLDQPHFERFGGAERVIQDIFGGDRDLATSALETARQDVIEGRVNEERRAYGRIVGEEPTRYEPTPEGEQGLIEGASKRAIPTGKIRPEARQKPVEETPLFQKEPSEEQTRLPGVEEGRAAYRAKTETPEFRRWFGASKVTDEDGTPQVVYHGTADSFDTFDPAHPGKKDLGWLGEGNYFTNLPAIASSYSILKSGAAASVMPVYLRIERPYMATLRDKEAGMLAERRGDHEWPFRRQQELEVQGYDGVILNFSHREGEARQQPAEYVVFRPEQIKSATGNQGSFDPADPSMVREGAAPYDASRQAPARFLGYQEGGPEPFALYNVTRDGQEFTYGADTLREKGIEVPETPTFEAWQAGGAGPDVTQRSNLPRRADVEEPSGPDLAEPRAPYAPPFFSGLAKLVEDKMPEAAPAAQVQNIVRQGKPDEVKWTGLDDWLRARGGARVTKQEVREFLKQNEVKVEETVHQAGGDKEAARTALDRATVRMQDTGSALRRVPTYRELSSLDKANVGLDRDTEISRAIERGDFGPELRAAARHYWDSLEDYQRRYQENERAKGSGTKFERYTLPGGREYRELLLTLPPRKARDADLTWKKNGQDLWAWFVGDRQVSGAFPHETDRTVAESSISRTDATNYHSPHWDEPNVLAHVRFNDRTDAGGARVLFLEEIQSDWHQEGRRRGYAMTELPPGYEVDRRGGRWYVWPPADQTESGSRRRPLVDGHTEAEARARALEFINNGNDVVRKAGAPVPAAPFAKTWHELALKRVLRWAAENGYDKVAWTPGDVQNERYDLSKHFEEISAYRHPEGDYDLSGRTMGDRRQHDIVSHIPEAKLPDYVGKDLADKIIRDEGVQASEARGKFTGRGTWQTFSGVDLKVGGEGMKGFYDRILPEFLNKYGKKWGARVGQTEIETKPTSGRGGEVYIMRVGEMYDVMDRQDPSAPPIQSFDSRSEAEAYIKTLGNRERVPSIDVTPEMKRAVLEEGQALFEGRAKYPLRPGVPEATRQQGEQLLLELGAPALRAESMTQRENLPAGQIAASRRGEEAGSGVRTLGLAIRDDLVRTGRVEMRGQVARTPDDVATLAQVYRDPRYETFRVMYVDEAGAVLATEGISSRLPGSSAAFLGPKSRAMYEMRDRMDRLGATGYWMIHNHPSGKPTPSSQDVNITRSFEERVPGFKGHVVINSKEYGFILPGHAGSTGTAPLETDEALRQPRLAHAELGKVVTGPKEVAAVGKAIESPEGFVTLLHRDSSGGVRAIQEMPEALFMQSEAGDYIRGRQRAFGAAETLAYSPHWTMDTWARAKDLVIGKTLLDAVTPTGSGIMDRLTPQEDIRRTLSLKREGAPIRVEEEKSPYGLDPDLAARIAEYGRAHAREAKDFASWSKRMKDELGPKVEPYLPRAYDEARQGARPAAAAPTPAALTATTPPPKGPTGPTRAAPSSGDPLKDIDAMARPPAKEPWRERLATVKEQVLETQVNRFEPLRRLSRALKEKGGRFEPGTEPIEVAEITKNRAMGQSEVFDRRLQAIIKDAHRIGADEDLNRYLTLTQFAKRIRDLSARPESGVTPEGRTQDGGYVNPRQFDQAKVDVGLAALQTKAGERWPQIEAMAKRVWDLNRQLLTAARDAGLISQDTYDYIVARGDDYVPMQVLDYLDEVGKAGASPRPFDVRYQDVLKRMEGTERDVRNVLASSYDKGLRVIATVNRNRAARAVGDLATALPGLVDEVPGDTFKLPEDREVVSAFYDGHRKNFAVPSEIKRSMDFLDDKQIGLIGRVLSQTKRPLQVGATGANLAFAIPNVIRDAKSAMILSKYGVKNPVDLVRFGADWIQGLLHSIKKDALWEEAASQGALFTMQKQISPETFLKSAKGESSLLEKINLVKHMVHGVEKMNNAMEEATKLASFQRGERFGAPIDELAYEVANYGGSPNFGRSGSWGQELNLLWMFYNARLQGTARTARRLKETPEAAGKLALWRIGALSAVPMLAAWAWNQQWDGDNGIENIPDGDKQRYHVILLPETYRSSTGEERRKYLKIPKEETEQVLGPMLNGFMDWMKGEHPPEAAAIAGDVVGALAPISFDVRGAPSVNHFVRAAASGVLSSANPAVRLPIEVGTNYNAFQQGPLVPRGLAEHVRPTEQARPTTSRTISEIATMLDRVPGAEALGLTSPIKLQHIVTSSTGGAGQSTLDTSDMLLALAKKHLGGIDSRPGTPETVPAWERAGRQAFLSRFMGTGGGAQDREAESRFYDALDAARRVRGSVKLVGKREGRESAEAIKQEERPYFNATKSLETTGKALGRIYRDQIEVTYFSSAPLADREQRLVDLAERRHRLLEKFRTLETETNGFTRTRAEAFP